MPSGIEILMKQMGVDPRKIMDSMRPVIEQTVGVLTAELTTIKQTQERVERKLDLLIAEFVAVREPGPNEDPTSLTEGGKLDNA